MRDPHDRPQALVLPLALVRLGFGWGERQCCAGEEGGKDEPSRIFRLYSSRIDSMSSNPSGGGLVRLVRILTMARCVGREGGECSDGAWRGARGTGELWEKVGEVLGEW